MKELKDFLGSVIAGAAVIAVICTAVFGVYLAMGAAAWLLTDPMDLFEDGPIVKLNASNNYTEGERRWDDCVRSTKVIFDDFNDTVGATYALGDKPATESQEFIKLCLEKNI